MLRPLVVALLLSPALIGTAPAFAQTPPPAPAAAAKNDYSKPETWLCRPGRTDDACAIDLTTTVIAADGTMSRETWAANPQAPHLVLSNRSELRAPLRWIAILRDQVAMSLAATSGIHFPEDVIKLLLVGADVCMITSTLLRHGVEYASEMIAAVQKWLDDHEYESVATCSPNPLSV